MPHPLFCFQGREIFLFWITIPAKREKKSDQITKVYKQVYTLYFTSV